jgi:acyl transferase domain-containing protein/acyl carrier protein
MKPSPEQIEAALRASVKEAEQLRRQNRDLRDASAEPIAIVGMACRLPGGVESPAQLWELLERGGDGVGTFPADRGWDLERIYDPDPERPATSNTREGGFLAGAADFDPGFFGISPREAIGADPQMRLMLEASWEALEDAGVDPKSLHGTSAGVFAGVMYHDYGWGLPPTTEEGRALGTGGSSSVISGHVAYTLGLKGPAISIDTACSSSLVGIHLACQTLRKGECSLALAGGVTVLATPSIFIQFSRQGGVAPDGRCKAFAEAADGAGFSEGVGVLVLERLSDADANGHRVLATIKGSAVNQDGASNGITAPNGPSQERVIRQALANAGLEPADVDLIEAHGTGTALGDPIEANALLATYGQGRETPLRLGSLKSNIGHAQAAAGVAGVIKAVLAMRAGTMPKTLHLDSPSSGVNWDAGKVELLSESFEWEPNGHPRRAGVSSFGATGTNAHLILEEAPGLPSGTDGDAGAPVAGPGASAKDSDRGEGERALLDGPLPFPLSAKSETALREQAARLAARLREDPALDPLDVAYSLGTTRARFERRAVLLADGREQLLAGLGEFERGETGDAVVTATATEKAKTAFVFSGNGSQWAGMAVELLDASPVFADSMRECEEALAPFLDTPLREAMRAPVERWPHEVELVQPIIFAVMVSLGRLWRACGIEPAAVAGHSAGEIAAAVVAGGLSLEDGARVASVRSQVFRDVAGSGGMVSIALPLDQLEARIAPWQGAIEIAALNGPAAAVLSGEREALDELLRECEQQGVRARDIPGAVAASHSSHMEPLRERLLAELASLSPRGGEIPFHSTVEGRVIDTATLDAEYWYRNTRQTVLFEPVVRELLGRGHRLLIEVSPHPVLLSAIQEAIDASGAAAVALGTLRRDEGGPSRFSLSLAEAQVHGAELDWHAFFAGSGAGPVPLPTYPFQHKRFWLNASAGAAGLLEAGLAATDHPLLGAAIDDPDGEGLALSGRLSLDAQPWLADHAAFGTVLLPGTAFVEMALRAGADAGAPLLEELTLEAPLVIAEDAAALLRVSVAAADADGRREVAIYSRPEGEGEGGPWVRHARGALAAESLASDGAPSVEPWAQDWPPPGAEPIDVGRVYGQLAEAEIEYGPAFQGLVVAWRRGEELYAEVSLPADLSEEARRFGIHPALFDAIGHAGVALSLQDRGALGAAELPMPFAWQGVRLAAVGARTLRVRRLAGDGHEGLTAADENGTPVLSVDSVVSRPVDRARLQAAASGRRSLYRLQWRPLPLSSGESVAGPVVEDLRAAEKGDPAEVSKALAVRVLERMRDHLAGEDQDSRLVFLTESALATSEAEAPNIAAASLSGLIRSAAAEHPGRFCLIDTDGSEVSGAALERAMAVDPRETEIALRDGELLVPRLAQAEDEASEPTELDPERTVLITGATGAIGALIAEHLAEAHGARHLLLVSRSGEKVPGALDLRARLQEHGAEATIAACDVSDRSQLEGLLAQVPKEHPLGAVIHCAAVLDDGLLESLDEERLERVFAPKADAAWHLHELSAGLDLTHFVCFSSIAGLIGSAAQANYAAANAFLDALAAHRRATGLAGVSMAWGGWEQRSEMTAGLDSDQLERLMRRAGERLALLPLSAERGLDLFDAALASAEALVIPAQLDLALLRSRARSGTLPALLEGIVRVPARAAGEGGSLARRLAAAPEAEREAVALEVVRGHVAAVLGHDSAAEVDPEKAFKDLGFDSLAAVELRNRLAADSGVGLAATAVFDYPSPLALAQHLLATSAGEGPVRRATVARAAHDEPIAIVGMACRFPGGAESPQQLWELLARGGDAISSFPADRGWDLERLYDPEPGQTGKSYVNEGGFLYDAADFDPGFFDISPREAIEMDPQQRLMLELSWEVLEDAGIDPRALRGSATGVFAGSMYQDYGEVAGMSSSAVSGRISYTLGLEGPALSIDTACSSSLVAMHLAAGALRGGECSLALAGGVAVLSTPTVFVEFSRQLGLASDGRCKAFAAAADGVGVSEGVGVLVLERLSDAEANGHRVLATIKGSAVNQDGASNGLTAPNGPSQERVIRQALANAGLEPGDVDMIEAHGTGTALGDPIEANALLATYGQGRETPLRLGSLKSNIGHAQAAAGVAGVIKAVMAIREGTMPKTLHLDAPSPNVDWEAGKVELLSEPFEWEANGHPRRAGVSSFGASGTNAHLILEQAPERAAPADPPPDGADEAPDAAPRPLPGWTPLLLSARSEPALRAAAGDLAATVRADESLAIADLARALATTRTRFERRAAIAERDRAGVLDCLDALARGDEHPAVATALAREERKPVFLFGGQGAQWAGMGLELSEASPRFAASLRACEEALTPHVDWSLDAVLREPEGAWLERLDVVQPALFALMVSLADLWRSLGVQPAAVVGHSQGEIAAAHVAGALSLEDAALIVAARGRAMTEIAGRGGMLWLSAPVEWLDTRLEDFDGRISLAAINGPSSLVVSGEPAALAELAESCRREGREARPVAVDYAAHSAQVDALEVELLEAFAPISPRSGEIPFHSTVTASPLDGAELGPAYWFRNLRQTVRFDPVMRSLLERGSRAFIEVAPHPVLAYGAEETIADALGGVEGAAVFGALRRDDGGASRFALSLAEASAHGVRIDWEELLAGEGGVPVSLPTYPFQRQRFWPPSLSSSSDPRSLGQESSDHPLLGAELSLAADGGLVLTGRLSRESQRWLLDHQVDGVAAVPASVWVELALTAAAAVGCELVEDLELSGQVALAETGAAQLQVRVGAEDDAGARTLAIHWRGEPSPEDEEEWRPVARASLRRGREEETATSASWPPPGAEALDPESLLDQLAARGLELGESFQCLRRAWREGASLLLELGLDEEQAPDGYSLHPALLQAALLCACAEGGAEHLELPAGVGHASVRSGGDLTTLRVTIASEGEGTSLLLADSEGRPVGELSGIHGRALERGELAGARAEEGLLGLDWIELEQSPAGYDGGLALLGDLDLEGPAVARYPDLDSLLAAGTAPALVIADCAPAAANSGSPPAAAQERASRVLELLQRWVVEPGLGDSRLALITRGAQATVEGEDADPAAAALWGLVRSAQAEHPGRFSLIDLGAGEEPGPGLAAALAVAAEEPQLALRGGALRLPRLAPIAPGSTAEKIEIDAERTVLVCDGGEQLGSLIAAHLVGSHGVRHLVLAYPAEGEIDPDPDIRARLEALGAEVRIERWDPADREQVRGLIDSIDPVHPLGSVVHAARALDDGVIESLDHDRLERALRQRADGAWHLHELTRELDLSRFLLISDAAGTLGSAAQANYAAANAFLDALAAHRQAQGLPAMSLAWGPIEAGDGGREISDASRARLRRAGLLPLGRERALELLDRALLVDRPFVAPIELDRGALRARAREGDLAAVLRSLAPASRRGRAARATFTERLLAVPEEERAAIALEELRRHIATVLGHGSGRDIDPERPFQELGFDSLAAVELRNRLAAATGMSLPPTLVFDYPTPAALAGYLAGYLAGKCGEGGAGTAEDAVEAALADLSEALVRLGDGGGARERVGMRLRAAVAGISGEEPGRDEVLASDLAAMSDDEVFALIDEEAGDG